MHKRFVKSLFRKLGIGITSYSNLIYLQKKSSDRSLQDLEFIRALGPANYELTISLLSKSKSQLRQDLFVVSETEHKIKYKVGGGISSNLVRQMESIFPIPFYSKQNFFGQAYSLNRLDCGRNNYAQIGQMHPLKPCAFGKIRIQV